MHTPGITNLPFLNTSRLPAFVAGFTRVLTMHTPGITNLPFLTSFDANSPRAASAFEAWERLISADCAMKSAIPLFGIAFTPFIALAFIAFMGAMAATQTQIWRRDF